MDLFGLTNAEEERVESFAVIDGRIEVVFRRPSKCVLDSCPPKPSPDHVWKDVYGVVDGEIKLIETIQGVHVPAHTVAERITFPAVSD